MDVQQTFESCVLWLYSHSFHMHARHTFGWTFSMDWDANLHVFYFSLSLYRSSNQWRSTCIERQIRSIPFLFLQQFNSVARAYNKSFFAQIQYCLTNTNGWALRANDVISAITPNGFFDPVREISNIRVDSWHICKSAFFPKWCDANNDIHMKRTPQQYLQNET